MKQGLYLGKSYLVANTLIGMNNRDNRNIVDDTDVKNAELSFTEKLNARGYAITFYDDLKENSDIITLKDNNRKVYVKSPYISSNDFTMVYRTRLPFGLSKSFEEVDYDNLLGREMADLLILKSKENRLLPIISKIAVLENKTTPKTYKKEYRVSEK